MQITIDRNGDIVWYMTTSQFWKVSLSSKTHLVLQEWTSVVSAGLYSVWGHNPTSKHICRYSYYTGDWVCSQFEDLIGYLEADPLSNLLIMVDTNGQLLERSDVEKNNMIGNSNTWEAISSKQSFKHINVYNRSILGIDESSQLYVIFEKLVTGMERNAFI